MTTWEGLGKKRSEVGKFIDRQGYSQEDLRQATGIGRTTISKLCNDPNYVPSPAVMKKLLAALREIKSDIRADDFFDF
ncbi:helix-turn-helix transcriptional regulator [Jeotgalibacillus proteolyticus]|uniref:Transcriptional regulator n=1 Tax=Jeotgalibacillus proteolyticus TaxID=2082395 RepID=A0A2S5GB99_9BACL|nr:helix-turn-helix transcriptional regulator [Jeotgalibacillus proteolyticus]PPA70173.1 transcriptional regulator [Jeotgalibacillus proteolyticus]